MPFRIFTAFALVAMLSACSSPGPYRRDLRAAGGPAAPGPDGCITEPFHLVRNPPSPPEFHFVDVRDASLLPPPYRPPSGDSIPPAQKSRMFTDLITERDQLEVTINDVDPNSPFYQTTERGARSGFVIGPIEVERDGILRLPYLQEIQALGLSLSQLSMIVTKAAREVSPSAEALVRRTARLDKRVFIYGEVDRTGERIIDRENYTLLEALAASGGPSGPPHLFTFVLHRDGLTYNTNVSSLAKQRVFVQDADILKVEQNPDLAFQVTGVIGKPGRYPFPDENPTLMDALSTAQGLDAGYSDARGVFVFRSDGKGGNLIYGVDVSRPDGMFLAQNFSVAPNDIVYISESPVSQWQRAVDLVFPVLDMATRVTTVIRAP